MNYYTIDYDVNRPMANQITVPMNSEYGIGVRVIKDNQPVNLEMGELSVNGMSATSQVNGYNLYELSSGNDTGMNPIEVTVQSGIMANGMDTHEQTVAANRVVPVGIAVYLSSCVPQLPTTIELTPYDCDFGGEYRISSASGIDPSIHEFPEVPYYCDFNGITYYKILDTDGKMKWRSDSTYYDTITIQDTSLSSNRFGISFSVGKGTKRTYLLSGYISIDTHGLKAKFPIQVNVADKGYFERRLENEQTII